MIIISIGKLKFIYLIEKFFGVFIIVVIVWFFVRFCWIILRFVGFDVLNIISLGNSNWGLFVMDWFVDCI